MNRFETYFVRRLLVAHPTDARLWMDTRAITKRFRRVYRYETTYEYLEALLTKLTQKMATAMLEESIFKPNPFYHHFKNRQP